MSVRTQFRDAEKLLRALGPLTSAEVRRLAHIAAGAVAGGEFEWGVLLVELADGGTVRGVVVGGAGLNDGGDEPPAS